MLSRTTFHLLPGLVLATSALAQNDECTGSIPLSGSGLTSFDTSGATTSSPWPCGAGGNDIWFRFLAPTTATWAFDTCTNTNFDTTLEAFEGTCVSPVSLACNDDACGLQSRVTISAVAGINYFVRVGGFGGATGQGELMVSEQAPPPECFSDEASFLAVCGNVTDSEDFAVYFNDTPFDVPGGLPIGANMNIEAVNPLGFRNFVETIPFQFSDNNGTPHASCYTNQDAPATEVHVSLGGFAEGFGCKVSGGIELEMVELVVLSGGAMAGVCSVASNDIDQFVGYADPGSLIDAAHFRSVLLSVGGGGEGFGLDDLLVCSGGGGPGMAIGTQPGPCSSPVPNSTGLGGDISAFGNVQVSAQDVRLSVSNIPLNQPGIFFTSQTIGMVNNPGGSVGNICVIGLQGRYNAVSQIFLGLGPGQSSPPGGLQVGTIPVPINPPLASFTPGTWYFQAWYRDFGGVNNFTDVVQIDFVP